MAQGEDTHHTAPHQHDGEPASAPGRPGSRPTRSRGRRPGRRSGRSGRSGRSSGPHRRWPGFTPDQLAARAASVPALVYPEELPVSARREEIAAAVRDHQVVVVAGETGSGKTTQLPKICLGLGRGVAGMIGHTQPRRIAARSVAERIASELGTPIGRDGVVGYQVRFTEETGPTTLVKLMTDGILLAEIQSDPMLEHYDTIIVDEAHERSLNIDFILGYLARLLPSRPDLKVIITSATIDSVRFAQHFAHHLPATTTHPGSIGTASTSTTDPTGPGGQPTTDGRPDRGTDSQTGNQPATERVPVIEVSGRTYPVEVRYRPLTAEDAARDAARSHDSAPEDASGAGGSGDLGGASPAPAGTHAPRGTPAAGPGDLTEAELDALTSPDPAVRAAARARREKARSSSPGQGRAGGTGSRGGGRPGSGGSRPGGGQQAREEDRDQVTGILDAVDELMAEPPGDILVFLAGERDIRDTEAALIDHLGPRYTPDGRSRTPGAVEVVPLYSRLSSAEQHRVFEAHSCQRVVLATNVAETSLTVPGIRYVVDPGVARISRYSNRTKVQRLPIEPVSQASADQRSGRCGRLADGIAVRLYSRDDYDSRPRYTEPEILRTSLASVILQMAALGLGSVQDFPFLDAPDPRQVRDGLQLLTEIGAVVPDNARGGARRHAAPPRAPGSGRGAAPAPQAAQGPRLTSVGRRLARLPIDPRLGRMLLEAGERGCAGEVMVIVAALSIQDVRERPADKQEASDAAHRRFADPTSDFLTYLNLWRYLRTQARELSGSAFRRMCRAEFLHYLRVREWQDVHAQLRQLARPLGLDAARVELPTPTAIRAAGDALERGHHGSQTPHGDVAAAVVALGRSADTPDAEAVHRSLLVGLLSNVGGWDERRREYSGARGTRFTVWPGSGLRRKTYDWVMTAELVETSRLFARTVARVEPGWVEEAADRAGLLRRVYGEPYWSTRRGAAMVHQRTMLYGMTLAADRPATLVSVGTRQARELAREMFLRCGLVEGGWHARHAFVERNRELVEDLRGLEQRRRVHGLLADDEVLYDFYDERVPQEVTSAAAFDAWWKDQRRSTPGLLDFTRELLLPGDRDDHDVSGYPDTWVQGDLTLPLDYTFDPGSEVDGVSVQVPVEVLGRLGPQGFDWLVPGLRPELCVATIRALPKRVRRQLVPAPDVGAQVWAEVSRRFPAPEGASAPGTSFQEAFTEVVADLREVTLTQADWQEAHERLPDHLRTTFVVLDDRDEVLGQGKDLVALQKELSGSTEAAVRSVVRGAVAQAMAEARARQRAGAGPVSGDAHAPGAGPGSAGAEGTRGSGRTRKGRGRRGAGGRGTADQQADTGPGTAATESTATSASDASTSAATTEAAVATGPASTLATTPGPAPGPPVSGLAEREGLTDWPQGVPGLEGPQASTIPGTVESTGRAGLVVRGYPALVARGHRAADLRVLPDAAAQAGAHGAGVIALALARTALPTGRVTSRWDATQSLVLAASPYPSTEALVADVQLAAARLVAGRWEESSGTPLAQVRERAVFERLVSVVREELEGEVHRVASQVAQAVSTAQEVERVVSRHTSLSLLSTLQEVRSQAAGLTGDRFVTATPASQLAHLPRYLKALAMRVERAASSPSAASQDAALAYQVSQALDLVEQARARAASLPADPQRQAVLEEARWMVEELRVSLFAQTLGTSRKVSLKRISRLVSGIG
ncbi:DUF3418 domain-containing protein [Actinomyces wuliandei]|uniref:DUF3418 domain-containing protein n=1 Tax=Actinomyces wuliandei TaxID=2057743 RepID=UPI000FDB8DE4|nr:DUF3418 domain-containing protein [Actinomyces wuliandei]